MEGNTVLHQLMAVRMENIMSGITESDVFYQETKQRAGEYSDKLDALQLPRETKLLIDRYAREHIANGSRYRELAYQLGFSDCAEFPLRLAAFFHVQKKQLEESGINPIPPSRFL